MKETNENFEKKKLNSLVGRRIEVERNSLREESGASFGLKINCGRVKIKINTERAAGRWWCRVMRRGDDNLLPVDPHNLESISLGK